MKVIFGADVSFNYFGDKYPGDVAAIDAMREAKECFEGADFSVINLETVFGSRNQYAPIKKSGPNQISWTEFKKYLEILSPSAVSLANNHTLDFGEDPVFDTVALLK